jgi:hypothetical protein
MPLVVFSFYYHHMLRLWPNTSPDQLLTPRASEKNPFNELVHTPTSVHPLLAANSPMLLPASAYGGSVTSDLTPQSISPFPSAQPTTHLSLHAPVFKMQQPPPPKKIAQSTSSASTTTHSATSKGQIHIKLIQARALNVRTIHARPYVVVQFEQNEFVSRDPISELDKEVKGTPSLSRQSSSNALSALGKAASVLNAAKRKNSKESRDASSASSVAAAVAKALQPPPPSSSPFNTLWGGRLSAHNPVWKHEVSL